MNESTSPQQGRKYCTEITEQADLGTRVTVCGWVGRARNLGGLLFVDVRDRSGIMQCVFDGTTAPELFKKAEALRSEHTVRIGGTLRVRSSINPNIETGRIEILADELAVFA